MAKHASTTNRERERELIARARGGDRLALRELVDLHKDRLYAFIWRMVRDHHDAEDICQEAFLKAFASFDTFLSEYRFSTWLFTIGYRVCLNQLRRKRSVGGEMDLASMASADDESPTALLESEEAGRVREMVWSAVDKLTAPQRATVLLFYRHELGCHEIARILQLPPATVKSHLHRARARLRSLLEPVAQEDWGRYRNLTQRTG